ncbi:MAG TPA: hypothetical protein VFL16_18930 [Steroidobacteraceae bacterium]|jgi:hypothetical protein|nr:hypothetical protein [Steroidobacteraceae bacterium]
MKSDLTIIGILAMGCGIFGYTQILQRANSRLDPQLLADLMARARSSWSEFLLPLAPTALAYLLVSRFPRHQAGIAIPAILLSALLLFLQVRKAQKRADAVGLPPEFIAERRKGNIVLLACLLVGGLLIYLGRG